MPSMVRLMYQFEKCVEIKGDYAEKIGKLFYFCHLKKLVRPETFGPYYVHIKKVILAYSTAANGNGIEQFN